MVNRTSDRERLMVEHDRRCGDGRARLLYALAHEHGVKGRPSTSTAELRDAIVSTNAETAWSPDDASSGHIGSPGRKRGTAPLSCSPRRRRGEVNRSG